MGLASAPFAFRANNVRMMNARRFSRYGKAADVAEIVEIAKIDDPAHRVRKPFPKKSER